MRPPWNRLTFKEDLLALYSLAVVTFSVILFLMVEVAVEVAIYQMFG